MTRIAWVLLALVLLLSSASNTILPTQAQDAAAVAPANEPPSIILSDPFANQPTQVDADAAATVAEAAKAAVAEAAKAAESDATVVLVIPAAESNVVATDAAPAASSPLASPPPSAVGGVVVSPSTPSGDLTIEQRQGLSHPPPAQLHAHMHGNQLHVTNYDPNRIIQHGGHTHTAEETERASGYIFLVMLCVIAVSQFALYLWKKHHPRSFDLLALAGLWLIPSVWSCYLGFYRFCLLWACFSVLSLYVIFRAIQSPVARTTPRLVYRYFYFIYRCCYAVALVGYMAVMSDFLGLSILFNWALPASFLPVSQGGFLCLFYGLYYGVVARDLCELASQRMAVNIGYVAEKGSMPRRELPVNTCAICDHALHASVRLALTAEGRPAEEEERVFTLECKHQFHEFCIRGWTIIGKRDTCPNCNEKVRLRSMFRNPWESQSLAWGFVLDGLRYMIVFNPIVLLTAQWVLQIVF